MSISADSLPVSSLSKYCNALESDDKRRRRKALEELKVAVFDDKSELQFDVKVKHVYKHLLRCFSDKAESCRELSINIITDILKVLPETNDSYFPYIVPILVQRLGNIEIVEPSEEVRLLLMELYHLIIKRFKSCLSHYVEELVQILLKTLNDPFPKMKKESCDCVCDLSKAIPRELFSHTAALAKAILQNFNFQHSRVRIAAIYATGELFVRGDTKALEPALVPLAERLFDQTPTVRRAVIEVVGEWLLNMPDRYSFFARFLPLLLTGVHDPVPEIRALTEQLWSAIGQQYLNENDESMKDKINYLPDTLTHYPTSIVRPSLGCRSLASRFLYVFVPALAKELKDWRPDVRLRAAQLIRTFIILAESNSTHYLPALADALSLASDDEDLRVATSAVSAGEALGAFVPAASWAKLLLWEEGDAAPTRGRLRLLAALVRAAPPVALRPLLPRLARCLCGADVRDATAPARRDAALDCCHALLAQAVAAAAEEDRPTASWSPSGAEGAPRELAAGDATPASAEDAIEGDAQPGPSGEGAVALAEDADARSPLEAVEAPLFRALLTLSALADDAEPAKQRSEELLLRLAAAAAAPAAHGEAETAAEAEAEAALWARQLPAVLRELRDGGGAWTVVSPERRVLEAVLARAGGAAGRAAGLALAGAALEDTGAAAAAAAAPEQPAEARVRVLTLLGAALAARPALLGAAPARGRAFAAALLRDALCPALVWKAGRAAEATRVAAAACLDALLRALPPADPDADPPDHAHEAELTESLLELLPLLPSLAEDSGGHSRLFALRCAPGVVKHLLNVTTDEYSLGQKICTLFQATLRRLDDVDDEVRGAALRCAERILPLIPKIAGAAVQADSAYDVLLIHLDDPNPKFRAGVLDVLERIGQLYPESLCEKTREALAKFRNPSEPEELLKRLEACSVSTE